MAKQRIRVAQNVVMEFFLQNIRIEGLVVSVSTWKKSKA